MPEQLIDNKGSFRRQLMGWYRREARELPWRVKDDPYVVWISEIMLQQTRVDQGTPYIMRFLEAFPTVQVLAGASADAVLKLWEGLGYYSRARNMHAAAQIIVDQLEGVFPRSADAWKALPGVGEYTAGAIASIAFDEPVAAVDGNAKRVLSRLLNLTASVDDGVTTRELWDIAGNLVRGKSPGVFNQGMMELGARICTSKKPECDVCPVANFCAARVAGTVDIRPVRRAKKTVPHHEIVIAAIRKNGRYLLGKRPPKGMLGGLWEFPGGKVERGETHAKALRREIREELGVNVKIGGLIATVNHAYSHFKVTLNVYGCEHANGTPVPNAHTELKWVLPREFDALAFPTANHKFLHLLR